MARNLSVARPYALAAFEYAREHQELKAWQSFFKSACDLMQEANLEHHLKKPHVQSKKILHLLFEFLAPQLNLHRKNYLKVLMANKRLVLLPAISELFNKLYNEYAKISNVRVITAVKTDDAFKKELTQALANRLKHDITLESDVDPSIIGGAVIHIGDRRIDGSIKGQLERLLESLR